MKEYSEQMSIKEAREKGLKYRCFHCLSWYKKKPKKCIAPLYPGGPRCNCPYFTPIEKCEEEERLIDESAQQAAQSSIPEGYALTKFNAMETSRIRRLTTN